MSENCYISFGKHFGSLNQVSKNVYSLCFILFIYLINLVLATLGLRWYAWAFSSWGEQGLLFIAVHRLLIAVASLVAEHGL